MRRDLQFIIPSLGSVPAGIFRGRLLRTFPNRDSRSRYQTVPRVKTANVQVALAVLMVNAHAPHLFWSCRCNKCLLL